jgi:hypothetical protein
MLGFHSNNGFANAPQCCVIRTVHYLSSDKCSDTRCCVYNICRWENFIISNRKIIHWWWQSDLSPNSRVYYITCEKRSGAN